MQPVHQLSDQDVKVYLMSVAEHVSHIEYYLHHLSLGLLDPERPHDITGPGHKLLVPVILGFSHVPYINTLEDEDEKAYLFNMLVQPTIELHQQQLHHRIWNRKGGHVYAADTRQYRDIMRLGACDTICAMLEERGYQERVETFDGILENLNDFEGHKRRWIAEILPRMRRLERPDLPAITSYTDFPNIGMGEKHYALLNERIAQAREELGRMGFDV